MVSDQSGYPSVGQLLDASAEKVSGWVAARKPGMFPDCFPMAMDIGTALVMRGLELLWGAKTETASRVRGRIESVLGWAKTREYRDDETPARWRGHLENLLPKKAKVAPVVPSCCDAVSRDRCCVRRQAAGAG